jgi:hypothetical protein
MRETLKDVLLVFAVAAIAILANYYLVNDQPAQNPSEGSQQHRKNLLQQASNTGPAAVKTRLTIETRFKNVSSAESRLAPLFPPRPALPVRRNT